MPPSECAGEAHWSPANADVSFAGVLAEQWEAATRTGWRVLWWAADYHYALVYVLDGVQTDKVITYVEGDPYAGNQPPYGEEP